VNKFHFFEARNMKTIIITGGIGAGKSVVCNEFKKLGAKVIGGDKVGHNCLKPNGLAYNDVIAEFGSEILNGDKTINRAKLAQLAFASRERLNKLNELTHKHILKEIVEEVDRTVDCDIIVLEIPLFRASDIQNDAVISVVADDEVRIERVIERSKIPREMIERIISLQPSTEEYRSYADFCIENIGTIDAFRQKAREIYRIIERM